MELRLTESVPLILPSDPEAQRYLDSLLRYIPLTGLKATIDADYTSFLNIYRNIGVFLIL